MDEEITAKLEQYIKHEMGSHEEERILVAELLDDIVSDSASANAMENSMHAIIDAAKSALKKIRELSSAMTAEELKAEDRKRFRVEYSVRHFNGHVDVTETSATEAGERLRDSFSTIELLDGCEEHAVDLETAYEVDEKGTEVPGTREDLE